MQIAFSPPVVEFVTVGAEYCAFLEQSEGRDRHELIETLLKLMPLLYVKALLLPAADGDEEYAAQSFVTEQDYNWLRAVLADIMAEEDEYEDFCYDEAVQTDEVLWRRVSEGLADIYQPVRDFVECYRQGVAAHIEEALWVLKDQFELFWGADLVDTLRRLHRIHYVQ